MLYKENHFYQKKVRQGTGLLSAQFCGTTVKTYVNMLVSREQKFKLVEPECDHFLCCCIMNIIFPIIWWKKHLLIDVYCFRSANLATLHSNANVNKAATDSSPSWIWRKKYTLLVGYLWISMIGCNNNWLVIEI